MKHVETRKISSTTECKTINEESDTNNYISHEKVIFLITICCLSLVKIKMKFVLT